MGAIESVGIKGCPHQAGWIPQGQSKLFVIAKCSYNTGVRKAEFATVQKLAICPQASWSFCDGFSDVSGDLFWGKPWQSEFICFKGKEERKSKLVSLDNDKESWKMSSILGEIESEKNCPFFIYVFAFSPIFHVRNC